MSKFTEAIANEIIDRMISGESVEKICREDHMPIPRAVMDWVAKGREQENSKYSEFAHRYELAQELRSEVAVDKLIEICMQEVPDEVLAKGNAAVHAWSNRQKLIAICCFHTIS